MLIPEVLLCKSCVAAQPELKENKKMETIRNAVIALFMAYMMIQTVLILSIFVIKDPESFELLVNLLRICFWYLQ